MESSTCCALAREDGVGECLAVGGGEQELAGWVGVELRKEELVLKLCI